MQSQIAELIKESLSKLDLKVAGRIEIEKPADPSYGDYSTNVALKLAKAVGKNPRQLAEEIVTAVPGFEDFSKVEVAGAGFINFYLSNKFLLNNLEQILKQRLNYGSLSIGKGKTVVVEYSSPNIAKQFSIGHLRSTVIGQAIYNLYSKLGYMTIGENHLGDWGTQFGMTLAQIERKDLDIKDMNMEEIERLYVQFNEGMKNDPQLRDLGKDAFRRLEKGDPETRSKWQGLTELSLKEFSKIYDLLDVKIDNAHGESFYEDKMMKVIEDAKRKGLVEASEGAQIIRLDNMPPVILLKSDGSTTYHTRDLAAIKYRIETWCPSLIVYEVGSEQSLHFKQVFEAARLLGWTKNLEFVHVKHGLILFGHKKMSTRKGTSVKLADILGQAIGRTKKIIESGSRSLSAEQKDEIAKSVGIGAVKYFDLSHNPETSINFDWDLVLNMQGNSGPYLQYTYARTQGVLKKSGKSYTDVEDSDAFDVDSVQLNVAEEAVLRQLHGYTEVLQEAALKFSPNLLCNYLFEVAQKFNSFYNSNQILDESDNATSAFRLKMALGTGYVLESGLDTLGIKALKEM